MDTPIFEKIQEGLTESATEKFNDPSKENDLNPALEKVDREFEKDLAPTKERIEETKTRKYEGKGSDSKPMEE